MLGSRGNPGMQGPYTHYPAAGGVSDDDDVISEQQHYASMPGQVLADGSTHSHVHQDAVMHTGAHPPTKRCRVAAVPVPHPLHAPTTPEGYPSPYYHHPHPGSYPPQPHDHRPASPSHDIIFDDARSDLGHYAPQAYPHFPHTHTHPGAPLPFKFSTIEEQKQRLLREQHKLQLKEHKELMKRRRRGRRSSQTSQDTTSPIPYPEGAGYPYSLAHMHDPYSPHTAYPYPPPHHYPRSESPIPSSPSVYGYPHPHVAHPYHPHHPPPSHHSYTPTLTTGSTGSTRLVASSRTAGPSRRRRHSYSTSGSTPLLADDPLSTTSTAAGLPNPATLPLPGALNQTPARTLSAPSAPTSLPAPIRHNDLATLSAPAARPDSAQPLVSTNSNPKLNIAHPASHPLPELRMKALQLAHRLQKSNSDPTSSHSPPFAPAPSQHPFHTPPPDTHPASSPHFPPDRPHSPLASPFSYQPAQCQPPSSSPPPTGTTPSRQVSLNKDEWQQELLKVLGSITSAPLPDKLSPQASQKLLDVLMSAVSQQLPPITSPTPVVETTEGVSSCSDDTLPATSAGTVTTATTGHTASTTISAGGMHIPDCIALPERSSSGHSALSFEDMHPHPHAHAHNSGDPLMQSRSSGGAQGHTVWHAHNAHSSAHPQGNLTHSHNSGGLPVPAGGSNPDPQYFYPMHHQQQQREEEPGSWAGPVPDLEMPHQPPYPPYPGSHQCSEPCNAPAPHPQPMHPPAAIAPHPARSVSPRSAANLLSSITARLNSLTEQLNLPHPTHPGTKELNPSPPFQPTSAAVPTPHPSSLPADTNMSEPASSNASLIRTSTLEFLESLNQLIASDIRGAQAGSNPPPPQTTSTAAAPNTILGVPLSAPLSTPLSAPLTAPLSMPMTTPLSMAMDSGLGATAMDPACNALGSGSGAGSRTGADASTLLRTSTLDALGRLAELISAEFAPHRAQHAARQHPDTLAHFAPPTVRASAASSVVGCGQGTAAHAPLPEASKGVLSSNALDHCDLQLRPFSRAVDQLAVSLSQLNSGEQTQQTQQSQVGHTPPQSAPSSCPQPSSSLPMPDLMAPTHTRAPKQASPHVQQGPETESPAAMADLVRMDTLECLVGLEHMGSVMHDFDLPPGTL